jgi:hypothetical protein
MAAPAGNNNAAKAKRWTAQIEAAMDLMDKSRADGLKTMTALAMQLIQKAEEGDMAALKEIGDRLEGKPKQQLDIEANVGVTIVATSIDEDL